METEKGQKLKCDQCGKTFTSREEQRKHESTCKK